MIESENNGTVNIANVQLSWNKPYNGPPAPHLLRGAIAERFADNSLFHQHEGERVIYRYPRVHYRWDRGCGVVVGFADGAETLLNLPWPDLRLRLGNQEMVVLEAHCGLSTHEVKPADRLLRYRFRAPWLPFNQENFDRYQKLDTADRVAELDRLSVAGILMALKGLGITYPERLYACFQARRSVTCYYKDQQMLGFLGTLLANVDLPNGFAIGRAVSHGYGWLVREE